MKLQRLLVVSAILAGMVAFGATSASAGGCPWKLPGVWVGCKVPGEGVPESCDPGYNPNSVGLVVDIQPSDLFMKSGTIDAEHSYGGIGNFQGNFKRTGRNRWIYELYAYDTPGKGTCYRDEGEFWFNQNCGLEFQEFIYSNGGSNIVECTDTPNSVFDFTGILWKPEVQLISQP